MRLVTASTGKVDVKLVLEKQVRLSRWKREKGLEFSEVKARK